MAHYGNVFRSMGHDQQVKRTLQVLGKLCSKTELMYYRSVITAHYGNAFKTVAHD
jgi:hypothetical protein